MSSRNAIIDNLRALAIIVMILTHSVAYYLGNKTAYFIWNYSHFAGPIFVFCSAYIFFTKHIDQENFDNLLYIKKRLVRLLVPYYLFACFYFLLIFVTRPAFLTNTFIFQSLTITGGIDINWLVLLFAFFTFLLPLLRLLIKKNYPLAIGYYLFAIGSTFYFLVSKPQPNFRFYMWLPWSTIVVYSYFLQKNKDKKKFILFNILGGLIVFISAYLIGSGSGRSTVLFDNKYPPNIYYLSYGFVMLNAFYLFFKKLATCLAVRRINRFLHFISINSFSLFFIHYLIIYLLGFFSLQNKVPWPGFFSLVLILSLIVQKILISLFAFNKKKSL